MQKRLPCLFLCLVISAVLSAQCPMIVNCPQGSPVICDVTGNDAVLWNDAPYTWSQLIQTADLYEGAVDLNIKILKCPGSTPDVSFTLFLDLDNDNLQESAVSSAALPPPGIVFANNAFNPGYLGGDPCSFDKRAIPDSLKFRFVLETSNLGDTTYALLRWNTGNQDILPRLPEGKHRILWRVEQGGTVKYCDYSFRIRDCLDPVITCASDITVQTDSGGIATLYVNHVMNTASDNSTPFSLLQFSMRNAGDGSGYPLHNGQPVTSLVYTCDELESHDVELWVRDALGNAKSCAATVNVADDDGYCHVLPAVCAAPYWMDTALVDDVVCHILWVDTAQNLHDWPLLTYADGCAILDTLPPASSFSVMPEKNTNPLNGVSTYDLVLISRHILGLDPFDAPWKWIAADANRSGSVTTFDVIEFRKLILGIYDQLPANTSWRFFTADCEFPAVNPLSGYCPSEQTFFTMPLWNYPPLIQFKGVKIGDVNGTVILNSVQGASQEERSAPVTCALPDRVLNAGESIDIPMMLTETGAWLGFQFGLRYDPEQIVLEMVDSDNLPEFDGEALNEPEPGLLQCSWYSALPVYVQANDAMLHLRLKAKRTLRLKDVIELSDLRLASEMYDAGEHIRPFQLQFMKTENSSTFYPAYPNPTTGGVTIPVYSDGLAAIDLQVTNTSGEVLFRKNGQPITGEQLLEVPETTMPYTGVYFWQLQIGDQHHSGKIIKN